MRGCTCYLVIHTQLKKLRGWESLTQHILQEYAFIIWHMQVQRDGIASKKSLAGWVCRFGWRGGGAGSWGWLWVGCVLHVAQAAQTGPRPPILPSGSQQTTRWPTIIPSLLICHMCPLTIRPSSPDLKWIGENINKKGVLKATPLF